MAFAIGIAKQTRMLTFLLLHVLSPNPKEISHEFYNRRPLPAMWRSDLCAECLVERSAAALDTVMHLFSATADNHHEWHIYCQSITGAEVSDNKLHPNYDDPDPYDEDCGDYVDCWNCGGEGFSHHDCGEDTCCCLYPEDNVRCDVCEGKGGWPRPTTIDSDGKWTTDKPGSEP